MSMTKAAATKDQPETGASMCFPLFAIKNRYKISLYKYTREMQHAVNPTRCRALTAVESQTYGRTESYRETVHSHTRRRPTYNCSLPFKSTGPVERRATWTIRHRLHSFRVVNISTRLTARCSRFSFSSAKVRLWVLLQTCHVLVYMMCFSTIHKESLFCFVGTFVRVLKELYLQFSSAVRSISPCCFPACGSVSPKTWNVSATQLLMTKTARKCTGCAVKPCNTATIAVKTF